MSAWKEKIIPLLKLNNSPREIALGIALGVFVGISPFYGLHTVMIIIFMLIIPRLNKLALFAGANISTPLTFPFISWLAYNIGRVILDYRYPPLSWDMFSRISWRDAGTFLRMIADIYYPFFIGSIVLGTLCAATAYLLTLAIIRQVWHKPAQK